MGKEREQKDKGREPEMGKEKESEEIGKEGEGESEELG